METPAILWGCCTNADDDGEFIICIKCNKSYHFECLAIPEISSDSEAYLKWKCSRCMSQIINSSRKEATPSHKVTTLKGNKRVALKSPPRTSAATIDDVRSIVEEVIKTQFNSMVKEINNTVLNIVNKELEPIKQDIRDISASLNFHTEEFEKFQHEHTAIKTSVDEIEKKNIELKSQLVDLNLRLNYLEQQARSSNLEIQCLPEMKQENLYTVVKQLGSVVGCNLSDNDIYHCTRVAKLQASSSRPRSVVVQLASPKIRDGLLASVMNYNKSKNNTEKLNSADLGLAGEKRPVYVLEHLSPSNKVLHAAARLKAKEKGYRLEMEEFFSGRLKYPIMSSSGV